MFSKLASRASSFEVTSLVMAPMVAARRQKATMVLDSFSDSSSCTSELELLINFRSAWTELDASSEDVFVYGFGRYRDDSDVPVDFLESKKDYACEME